MRKAKPSFQPFSCRSLSITRALLAVLCLCCAFWPTLADAQIAGRVISLTPGAFVERGGTSLPLTVQSEINEGDVLLTDASGRMRVLFADDSSVSLAPSSRLSLTEFTMEGKNPSFKAHLGQGLMRAITGKIVETNPEGFALNTPEAAIGIRGTILSVRSERGVTTVYVENTLRKVYVNGINVPGGQKITIPKERIPKLITPEDRRYLGRELAFDGGAGVASAAPEPSQTSKEPDEQPAALLVAGGLPTPESQLTALPLDLTAAGDSLASTGGLGGGSGVIGTVSGTISGSMLTSYSFGFQVDLVSGSISGGSIIGTGPVNSGYGPGTLALDFTNGSGMATASSFSVSNFTDNGSLFNTLPLDSLTGTDSLLQNTGPFNLLGVPDTGSVPVDMSIYTTFTGNAYDFGTGTGTMHR